jgi:hypothetical protein
MAPEPVDYVIRGHQVTHERLDDEVIAIDLERGAYYAMVGPAADIWSTIVAGSSTAEACRVLAARYGADLDVVQPDVESFVQRLAAENLIVPRLAAAEAQNGTAATPNGVATSMLPDPVAPVRWTTPELERYDDMADLVLLDPIHEVDEGGWPKLKTEQ